MTKFYRPIGDKACVFPIGAIYISANETNPSKWFGGTWVQLKDRFLFATNATSGNKGKDALSSDTGTSTNAASGNTGSTTLTAAQSGLPRHEHDMYDKTYGGYTNQMGIRGDGGGGSHKVPTYSQTNGWSTYKPAPAGGDDASEGHTHTLNSHTHEVPYIEVYVWQRTA